MCGEQFSLSFSPVVTGGSSPRVRGTGLAGAENAEFYRFIPACAGNRWNLRRITRDQTVHPRVCGEQASAPAQPSRTFGSSPRVRGTGRGGQTAVPRLRFIPACAGNRWRTTRTASRCTVHPRVCGEQKRTAAANWNKPGSSPRVRGTARSPRPSRPSGRFIPACAGNSPLKATPLTVPSVHPRVCGEQRPAPPRAPPPTGSSPRVRGTAIQTVGICRQRRFIPACAGNSCTASQ